MRNGLYLKKSVNLTEAVRVRKMQPVNLRKRLVPSRFPDYLTNFNNCPMSLYFNNMGQFSTVKPKTVPVTASFSVKFPSVSGE